MRTDRRPARHTEDMDEPIRMTEGATGPRAALVGGPDVWEVIATVRDHHNDPAEAAAYLDLLVGLVEAALAYYEAHRQQIDREIAANEQASAQALTEADLREVEDQPDGRSIEDPERIAAEAERRPKSHGLSDGGVQNAAHATEAERMDANERARAGYDVRVAVEPKRPSSQAGIDLTRELADRSGRSIPRIEDKRLGDRGRAHRGRAHGRDRASAPRSTPGGRAMSEKDALLELGRQLRQYKLESPCHGTCAGSSSGCCPPDWCRR
jgi:hypothetical protein